MLLRGLVLSLCAALLLTGCGEDADPDVDPDQVNTLDMPTLGDCRVLEPKDVAEPSNANKVVPCTSKHTAQTYAVGPLPAEFENVSQTNAKLATFAYQTCSAAFETFLGADQSLVMRTVVSWAWFRPSKKAWDKGARWYRCDIVGGGEQSKSFVPLPETAQGLLTGKPDDRWMVCANGRTVDGAVKVPCAQKHNWRAVTTIKLGLPTDPWPGESAVQAKTKQFCSDSVHAWLNYPVTDYEYAYTWFHEAEWEAGNRRSVCWAKTDQ